MSFALMNSAISLPLPPARRMILLQLARMANPAGVCWPSVRTIARQCCVSVRCVFDHLAKLAKEGFIQRSPRIGRSTVYTVTVPNSGQAAAEPTSTCESEPAIDGVVLAASAAAVAKEAVVLYTKRAPQPVPETTPDPTPVPAPASKPNSATVPASPALTLGSVVQAMRAVGMCCADEPPGLATLVTTASDEREFTEAASEAIKRGKGFAWALARVAGKRRDAASTPVHAEAAATAEPADTARPDRDPVLIQIERDAALATPPPAKVREQLAQLRAKLLFGISQRKAGTPLT